MGCGWNCPTPDRPRRTHNSRSRELPAAAVVTVGVCGDLVRCHLLNSLVRGLVGLCPKACSKEYCYEQCCLQYGAVLGFHDAVLLDQWLREGRRRVRIIRRKWTALPSNRPNVRPIPATCDRHHRCGPCILRNYPLRYSLIAFTYTSNALMPAGVSLQVVFG